MFLVGTIDSIIIIIIIIIIITGYMHFAGGGFYIIKFAVGRNEKIEADTSSPLFFQFYFCYIIFYVLLTVHIDISVQ
jgi:hypothetical protein